VNQSFFFPKRVFLPILFFFYSISINSVFAETYDSLPGASPSDNSSYPGPSYNPNFVITQVPTPSPSFLPMPSSTATPGLTATPRPTFIATPSPTIAPSPTFTAIPSYTATLAPVSTPTPRPSYLPSSIPTQSPTSLPTETPTLITTPVPTPMPIEGCEPSIFGQWLLYGASGAACESQGNSTEINALHAELNTYNSDLNRALALIEEINRVLANPDITPAIRARYENGLRVYQDYIIRVHIRIDEISARLAELRNEFNSAKNSFISNCSLGFSRECLAHVPSFIEPDLEGIKAAAKTFCEGQFNSTLQWQCPYLNALKTCEENYTAAKRLCEPLTGLRRTSCNLNAWNNKRRCEKNPPGYPGEVGKPNGIPDEGVKYCELLVAAMPMCLVAIF